MTVTTTPDVWSDDATGTEWCDCGEGHALDEDRLEEEANLLFGGLPERLTHRQVIALAARVWNYVEVCEFFTGCVADAAKEVNGAIADDYPVRVGLAIVKAFSNGWNGCPMENCAGGVNVGWE